MGQHDFGQRCLVWLGEQAGQASKLDNDGRHGGLQFFDGVQRKYVLFAPLCQAAMSVSYKHLRAHETVLDIV